MGAKSKVKRREKGDNPLEPPPSFERELSSFLAWVQLEKGLAENTIVSYENDLVQCSLHLFGQGVPCWQNVEIEHLSCWLGSLTRMNMQLQAWLESYLPFGCLRSTLWEREY